MLRIGMSVYLLVGPPVFFALAALISEFRDLGAVMYSLLRGVLVWVIGYLVYLFIAPLVPIDYTASGIYGYYLFHDFGYWVIVAAIGYLLFYFPKSEGASGVAECTAFALGVFLLSPVVDLIRHHQALNPYYLFMLPTLRISMVALFAAIVPRFRRESKLLRTATLIGYLCISLVTSLVPLLSTMSRPGYSYLFCGVLFAGSVVLFTLAIDADK